MRKDYFERTYRLRIRIVYLSILSSLILGFYFFPKIIEGDMIFEAEEFTEIMNVEIIKPIQQQQQFKSARPSIPIEADDESEIELNLSSANPGFRTQPELHQFTPNSRGELMFL